MTTYRTREAIEEVVVRVDSKQAIDKLEMAIKNFADVRRGWETNKSLGWDLSVQTLNSCVGHLNEPETRSFLDEYFLVMINVLLTQSPKTLGVYEKKCIDDSLTLAIQIIVRTITEELKYLQVLTECIFDLSKPYYAGSKVNTMFYAGCPQVRLHMARKFAELGGFRSFLDVVKKPTTGWLGADLLEVMARNFQESSAHIDDKLREDFASELMNQLLGLSDDQAKKENSESVASLIRYLNRLSYAARQDKTSRNKKISRFYDFWMNHTRKAVTSGSLVQRLFGWDQLQELIKEAGVTRKSADAYLVKGAGTEDVNGLYEFSTKDAENAPVYVKQPSVEGGPLLTLFRCNMKNKSKWWFISIADKEKPGTEKDVDYYQHKSNSFEEKEPPKRGWVCINVNAPGKEPPPVLQRLDRPKTRTPTQVDEGTDEEEFDLMAELPKWVIKANILNQAFSTSPHREVISRSARLVLFLAEHGFLQNEHIAVIWNASITSRDADIEQEIYSLLAATSIFLDDSSYGFLIDLASKALSPDSQALSNANSSTAAMLAKAAHFVECISRGNFRDIVVSLSESCSSSLLSFVWKLYSHPNFDGLKNGAVIRDFLSKCFALPSSRCVVMENCRVCMRQLEAFAAATPLGDLQDDEKGPLQDYSAILSELRSLSSSPTVIPTVELSASHLIQTLQFLLSRSLSCEGILTLESEGLSLRLVAELKRFVLINRPKFQSGACDKKWYVDELTARLFTVCHYYGLFPELNIPHSTIDFLWALLKKLPEEAEVLFKMLRLGSENTCSIGTTLDFIYIFENVICNPGVDWSKCKDESFCCFQTYFEGLESMRGQDLLEPVTEALKALPPELGLDTLWKIALHIASPAAQKIAVDLLIKCYEHEKYLGEGHIPMIDRVFKRLADLTSLRGAASPESIGSVSQCLELISTMVTKSKSSPQPSQGLRGRISHIPVTVSYKRVFTTYNYSNQSNNYRVDKGSEAIFSIEVSPMQTVEGLKSQIAVRVNAVPGSKVFLEGVFKGCRDSCRLLEFGLAEGAEIYAFSYATQTTSFINKGSAHSDFDAVTDFELKLPSVGQVIAENRVQFNALVALTDSFPDADLAASVWQLLMMLPTQPEMETEVLGGADVPWADLLLQKSALLRTYYLQIIDFTLQPALASSVAQATSDLNLQTQRESALASGLQFRHNFRLSNGFTTILDVFASSAITEFDYQKVIEKAALAISLHALHFLLFEPNEIDDSLDDSKTSVVVNASRLAELKRRADTMIEKLLSVASASAAAENSGTVHDALVILTQLLQSPETAALFIDKAESQSLVAAVLRSGSKKVREMAADFAIQVGSLQPVVLSWLVIELRNLRIDDKLCEDTFRATIKLMGQVDSSVHDTIDLVELSLFLQAKFLAFPLMEAPPNEANGNKVLLGYLQLFESILTHRPDVVASLDSLALTRTFINDYLFTLPTFGDEKYDRSPVCDSSGTKLGVFKILGVFVTLSGILFREIIDVLDQFACSAEESIGIFWALQVSQDIKPSYSTYSGLKNQGCTCYINSSLQQLFMNEAFREATLNANLKECHRATVHHRVGQELVGCDIMIEGVNGAWRGAQVLSYNIKTNEHIVKFFEGDEDELASMVLGEGSTDAFITGNYRMAPLNGDEAVTEREEAAFRVLEQLQRTFCFMKYSKKRFFDPKPFIEACKTLNLNFNVYHQNDASEFCGQLFDRIETATACSKHTHFNAWLDVFQKEIFGGKFLYQKVPQDCEIYADDKRNCGHWQSSRQDSFLHIEIEIRQEDNLEDALAALVAGELMDGDNKIDCEVCAQKKAAVRRSCLEVLPNMLIFHLKRFDIDYTIFETVKLNNRMAFETKINLLRFTKEGMEYEERKKELGLQAAAIAAGTGDAARRSEESEGEQSGSADSPLVEPDSSDYEFDLHGVLVHSGVAQGGHYYSFIKDSNSSDKWFRFDDEDVIPFNPEQIPSQCFGGPANANSEEHRTSNALLLFFNKTRKSVPPSSMQVAETALPLSSGSKLVNGYDAFRREVQASNKDHLLLLYMLEPSLHVFVRDLLSSVVSTGHAAIDPDRHLDADTHPRLRWCTLPQHVMEVPLVAVTFASRFLFDVVLHCRERASMRAWVQVFKNAFQVFPHTALELVRSVVLKGVTNTSEDETNDWFDSFLLTCSDSLARSTFVQILTLALAAIASRKEEDALVLLPYLEEPPERQREILIAANLSDVVPGMMLSYFVHLLVAKVYQAVAHVRFADEIFMLIREVAAGVPCIRCALLDQRVICALTCFVTQEIVPIDIKQRFSDHLRGSRVQHKSELFPLFQSIFEALAALVGVPQIRKVPLLLEKSTWEGELTPDAKAAFTAIFDQVSRRGGMDVNDIIEYKEKTGIKVNANYARTQILDRFATLPDGRLSLEGFLQSYTELASAGPKDAWKDLHAFGFKNDLSRPATAVKEPRTKTQSYAGAATNEAQALGATLNLSIDCLRCLACVSLYQAGFDSSDASVKAIARQICSRDLSGAGSYLLKQAMTKLMQVLLDYNWGPLLPQFTDFLKTILGIDDASTSNRFNEFLLNHEFGVLRILINEQHNPTQCRMNDYDPKALFKRYFGILQDFVFSFPDMRKTISAIAEHDVSVRTIRGMLRTREDSSLTQREEDTLRATVVHVQGAGAAEVNGDYAFSSIKCSAGMFTKIGLYNGETATFYLYKCSVQHGGYQWFISIVPSEQEPGSNTDIDFYFSYPSQDRLQHFPPTTWAVLQNKSATTSKIPAPQVTWTCSLAEEDPVLDDDVTATDSVMNDLRPSIGGLPLTSLGQMLNGDIDDIDSDRESLSMMADEDLNEDSFCSTSDDAFGGGGVVPIVPRGGGGSRGDHMQDNISNLI